MTGSLELRREPSGYRHYLCGRQVHAGSFLDMSINGHWETGRYEWSFRPESRPYMVFQDEELTIYDADLLRWPEDHGEASR